MKRPKILVTLIITPIQEVQIIKVLILKLSSGAVVHEN